MSAVAPKRAYNMPKPSLDNTDLEQLLKVLPTLSPKEQQNILRDLEDYETLLSKEKSKTNFLQFVNKMWPDFIMGRHHRIMAEAFEDVASGKCKICELFAPSMVFRAISSQKSDSNVTYSRTCRWIWS